MLAAQGADLPLIVAWIVAELALIVVLGVFLRRAWLTGGDLDVRDLRYGPTSALLGWWVPVRSLFVPKRIADDLWRATAVDPDQPYWSYRSNRGSCCCGGSASCSRCCWSTASPPAPRCS